MFGRLAPQLIGSFRFGTRLALTFGVIHFRDSYGWSDDPGV